MSKYKRVPWYLRKRQPHPPVSTEDIEPLAPLDASEPRYFYRIWGDGYAVYERPRTSGIYRSAKILSVHMSSTYAGEQAETLNAIWEGLNRYYIEDGKIYDRLTKRKVWSGKQDIQAKLDQLNTYERERLLAWT